MITALMLIVGIVLGIGLGKRWFSCKHKSFFEGVNMLEVENRSGYDGGEGLLEDPQAALRE